MPQPRGNRLAGSTSPYLRQHAHQPVDWWPWGPEPFDRARVRQVPILLSVGYSACHWCHVMAHESFEDEQLALAINEGFVAVKVDREERPDIDAVYIAATHLTTGSAGWPMTVFLTPDGEPFHCGTYYPPDRFRQILTAVRQAWLGRRDEVLASAAHLTSVLRSSEELGGHDQTALMALPDDDPDEELLAGALATVSGSADPEHGGFGGAPKFPMAMVLEALLRHHRRTGSARALELVRDTGEAMARGGLYDQLGGGFARYSVDAGWRVPHFEKMLYDNALLARVYLHWWQVSGDPLAERVAMQTCDWIVETMTTPQGGFASALDADTDGVEGATYLWTPDQLVEVLGPLDGPAAAQLLGVTGPPSTELGWTLTLAGDPTDRPPHWWEQVRDRLATARAARPQPARDGKVVTAWNGLAIAALAEAGAVLGTPGHLVAARRAADYLLANHRVDGRLVRSSLDGRRGSAAGVAADYGDLAEGLLTLHQVTGEPSYLTATGELLDIALAHLGSADGGFFDTLDDRSELVTRPRSTSDSPEPSGQSALAQALLTYGHLTGSTDHLRAGRRAVAAGMALLQQAPLFAGWTWAAAEALADGPFQVAVSDVGPGADALWAVALQSYRPGRILVRGRPDSQPLLAGRGGVDGASAAYVCRGTVCGLPLTRPEDLAADLRRG